MKPTARYVRSLLRYSPETGEFFWLVSRGSVKAGRKAGSVDGSGYIQIRIDKAFYKAHCLAWLYVYHKWPRGRLDHRDGDFTNNRMVNLRRASHSQNMANRKLNKNSTTGFKGVTKRGDRFLAYVNKDGQRHWLGYFPTAAEAHAAYVAAAQKLHGEFARAA